MTPQDIDRVHQEVATEMGNEFLMVPFTSSLEIGAYGYVWLSIHVSGRSHAMKFPVIATLESNYRQAFRNLIKNELTKAELDMGIES